MSQEPAPLPAPGDTGEAAAGNERPRRKQRGRAGMAFGIGSAALVAALLYANRARKKGDRR